jgi:hypothetical protein
VLDLLERLVAYLATHAQPGHLADRAHRTHPHVSHPVSTELPAIPARGATAVGQCSLRGVEAAGKLEPRARAPCAAVCLRSPADCSPHPEHRGDFRTPAQPTGSKCRYSVARPKPIVAATSVMVSSRIPAP